MSALQVIDFAAPNHMQQFVESLHETGFAVIKNHGIDLELLHNTYDIWQQFFNSADKDQYALNHDTNAGYFSKEIAESAKGETLKDIKEMYHFYPNSNYYPDYTKQSTCELRKQMLALGEVMLEGIQQYSPEEVRAKYSRPLKDMIKVGNYHLFRLLHYPPFEGNEPAGAVRAAAHTDINIITLLFPSSAKGLELKLKTGEWEPVPTNKDWMVINIGDMLDECSGGYFPATLHRVVNPEGEAIKESRLSMPFFLHADDDVVLSERHTGKSYRHERFLELGLYTQDQLDKLNAVAEVK